MKVLVKWKKSIVFSILVLMVLAIYITIGTKGEEQSKFGYTVFGRYGAATHLNSCDINVVSKKNYMRFFPDTATQNISKFISAEMKKRDIDFIIISDDYSFIQEFYVLNDVGELSDAGYEEYVTMGQGDYVITNTPAHDDVTIGGIDYHRVCYSRKDDRYGDYGVVAEYFISYEGHTLQIRSYLEESIELVYENEIDNLIDNSENLIKDYSFGKIGNEGAEENYLLARWKSLTFAPWIILIPFVYALLCGITFTGRSERLFDNETKKHYYMGDEGTGWNEDFLSLKTSKMILGFFAVLIVFHHLVQQSDVNDAGILYILENFGVGFVGMFFFFSGFGLYESFKAKEGYLKKFFAKRLPPVLVPFYITIFVFIIARIIESGVPKTHELIGYITGWNLINSHMWYIVEIVLLYILFFIAFRLFKNERIAVAFMFVTVGIMVGISLYLGHGDKWFQGEWWYNTSMIFPFGIWFAKHKDFFVRVMKRFYPLLVILVAVLFTVFHRATEYMLNKYSYWSETFNDKGYDDKLRCLSMQLPMVLFFVLLVLLIGMKIKVGNRVLTFLGEISLELYLIHNLFIGLFSSIKGVGALYTSVIIASIIAAYILHEIDRTVIHLIVKKSLPPKKEYKKAFDVFIENRKKGFEKTKFLVKSCFKYVARHKGLTVKALFRHFVCLVLCFISLFPICILIINSTKSTHEIISGLSFLPGGDFAENFAEAKGILYSYGLNLYTVIGRSCLISVTCSVVGTYIGAMCAYGFEYYNFKGKNTLWWPVFASMMVPAVAGAVGYIKFVYKFHMYNHYYPIILVGIVIPSCVYFLRMYFHAFRLNEIIEAARIDGCNEFKIFNKIIVPMIRPAILLQLIFNFATNWNNTIYQKLVLLDVKKKTISIFLNLFAGYNGASTDPGLFCFLLASTIPSFVVYILFSSGIMSRINIGSIKE